jgi:nucleotide-binding universal stress UspA family protein
MMTAQMRSLSSISCILQVSEEAQSAALPLAAGLAEASGAYLGVTVVAPKAHVPFSLMGSSYVAPMLTDINQRTLSIAETVATEADQKIKAQGLAGHVIVDQALVDEAAARAVRSARASDLIVVDQPTATLDLKGLVLEEALFRSGHPVLVASPKCKPTTRFERIMIAWDGSQHAGRAVSDAIGLFPGITHADIVVVLGEKPLDKILPGAELAHHLARKGIEARLVEVQAGGQPVGRVLDQHAANTGADLIVMGGFGHSRLREFLFGGVTVDLTQSACRPLLMAY